MRSLIFAIAAMAICLPAQAQRVFRASSIDMEQNERLDSLESRLAALEAKPAPVVAKAKEPAPAKVVKIEPPPVQKAEVSYVTAPAPAPVQSNRYSMAELKAIADSYRGPTYATVEPASWAWEHLQNDHGFSAAQVAGLSQREAIIIHNMAHGGKIRPTRSGSVQAMTVATPATVVSVQAPSQPYRTQTVRTVQSAGGCPGGQCPTSRSQTTVRTRGRIFPRLFR